MVVPLTSFATARRLLPFGLSSLEMKWSPSGELIFYFQSRGMDALTAHGILTYGFAAEVVDEIPLEALQERLAAYVFDKYSPK